MSEIKVLRLKSGEEIIAGVSEDANAPGVYKVRLPMLVIPQMDPAGKGLRFSLFPFMVYTKEATKEDAFIIKVSDVLLTAVPQDDMANQYKQYTGEGVITAPKQLLIAGG